MASPTEHARRGLLLLTTALLGGGLALLARDREEPHPVAVAAPSPAPPEPEPSPQPAPVAAAVAMPAPASPGFHGFCPAKGEEPTPFDRPTLATFLNGQDRAFNDRLQSLLRAEGASPALEQAQALLHDPGQLEQALALLETAPERRSGGFDLAARSLVRAAAQAVEAHPGRALELATRAATEDPQDAAAEAMRAYCAQQLGDVSASREALRRAFHLAPAQPAVAWALVRRLQETVHLDELRTVLQAYLQAEPSDVAASQLLARVDVQREIQAGYSTRERAGLTLAWPPKTLSEAEADALLTEVSTDLNDAAHLTGTDRRAELTVVVYPGREELLAVSCVNTWTAALYDGTLRIVAHPGTPEPIHHPEVRHEALHAQLGPSVPGGPYWFHEGLATFFAEATRADLLASQRLMVRNHTCIPFRSLEGSFSPFEADADAVMAYAQSLGMVQLLAARGGSGAIPRAVRYLRDGGAPPKVLSEVMGSPVREDDLLGFLGAAR